MDVKLEGLSLRAGANGGRNRQVVAERRRRDARRACVGERDMEIDRWKSGAELACKEDTLGRGGHWQRTRIRMRKSKICLCLRACP